MNNNVILRRLEEKDAEAMLEWVHDLEIQMAFRFNQSFSKAAKVR